MLVTGLGLHRALEGEDVFLDVISNWARYSMDSGIKLGIINGDKDSIMPQRSATRAECIVIIERLLKTSELINRETVVVCHKAPNYSKPK